MGFAVGLLFLLLLALVWLLGIQSGEALEGRNGAGRRLTQLGLELFEEDPRPTHGAFVEKMGGACRAAGVSTVAAFYGMRAMAAHGGITRERVALLLAAAP